VHLSPAAQRPEPWPTAALAVYILRPHVSSRGCPSTALEYLMPQRSALISMISLSIFGCRLEKSFARLMHDDKDAYHKQQKKMIAKCSE
jgi:hypothetical protein